MPPIRLPLNSLHSCVCCPVCGSPEVASYGPRTRYGCGSSAYDSLTATLIPGPGPRHLVVGYPLRLFAFLLLHLAWTRISLHRREQWDLTDSGLRTIFAVHLRTVNTSTRLFALTNRGLRR